MSVQADQTLDCSGLACPMPILKTKKSIDAMQIGQVLKMIATDAGSVPDVNAWTKKTGHALLSHEERAGTFTFYIRKTK
jgi:tRNA 2-thiouridine synthesizing protein A